MFPTPTFVPSKECSGVRFVTSPAENKTKKGSMQMDCEPRGPLWALKQRNLKAKTALRILNYHADAFWVMLGSTCTYFYGASSSSFTVLNPSRAIHQIMSPKYTCLQQPAITETSKLSHTATCYDRGNLPDIFSPRRKHSGDLPAGRCYANRYCHIVLSTESCFHSIKPQDFLHFHQPPNKGETQDFL